MVENNDLLEFIAKAQGGQNEAFGKIYDSFSQPLFRFIHSKVQGKHQAEDLLQETFIKAWKGLPTYRPEGGNFSSWLYRIAVNTVTDHYRKTGRSLQTVEIMENIDLPTSENHEAEIDINLDALKTRELLNLLPEKYRIILELRYLSDLTIQETAKILGKSELAIRVLQHRAIKKIRLLRTHFKNNL
jgi:RNA polymerase sigma-70 factor (ECF subfamily)